MMQLSPIRTTGSNFTLIEDLENKISRLKEEMYDTKKLKGMISFFFEKYLQTTGETGATLEDIKYSCYTIEASFKIKIPASDPCFPETKHLIKTCFNVILCALAEPRIQISIGIRADAFISFSAPFTDEYEPIIFEWIRKHYEVIRRG